MDAATVIRNFATGHADIEDIVALGVQMIGEPPNLEVTVPAGLPEVRVSAPELASGLLAAWVQGTNLAAWAALTIQLVEFRGNGTPADQALVGALWDAAFCEPLSDDLIALARALANRA